MSSLDPFTFFLWDKDRLLIDIRQRSTFLKGSLENAISIPVSEKDTVEDFKSMIRDGKPDKPLHLIDLDGSTSACLSRGIVLSFLDGGYKSFKTWRAKAFENGPSIRILGGYTGSGKTDLLQRMKIRGHQIIDFEDLALHKGSVFGNLQNITQPLHEEFQNKLLKIWLSLDPSKPVWLEEKGPFLGTVGLPEALRKNMQIAKMVLLDVPFDKRLTYIKQKYGHVEPLKFKFAMKNLEARIGTSNYHKALHFFNSGQTDRCFTILLEYYDRAYNQRRSAGWSGETLEVTHAHENCEATIRMLESI